MAYGNYAPFYRGGFFNPMQTPTMPPMVDNQNQFAQPYQPPMQQPTQPITPPTAPTQTPQMSNDMIWVQGLAGAKAYLVAPNTTVTLWDSENPVIYLKSCDVNGMPSMKILDVTEHTEMPSKTPTEHVCKCGNDIIPKSELNAINGKFDDISGKIEELEHKIKEMSVKPMPKTTKTTKTEE